MVKEVKTELGRYLEGGQKHLTAMKKDFANDTEVVAAIDDIEKKLTTAISHNKEMIACCENQTFDKIATMSCCSDLVKQLDKVRHRNDGGGDVWPLSRRNFASPSRIGVRVCRRRHVRAGNR